MAPLGEEDPLNRAREVRAAEQLQEADRPCLETFRTFLQNHEAAGARSATHTILEGFPDWWCRSRRAPPGLCVEEEADIEELYRTVGALYSMGIPLTIAEKRTELFRFFQDIEVWGTKDAALPAENLVGPHTELALLMGRVMGEVFPEHAGFLDVAVYDATGLSQTKGVKKTSLRLVWLNIVVDAERAARVRDLVVHRLTAASADSASTIGQLEASLKELSPGNLWHSVFGDAAYGLRSAVRLPLCDRVSPLPLRAPERRPLSPSGVLRFFFVEGALKTAEWLCRQAELDGGEWVKIGSLRLGADAKLTPWSVPQAAQQVIPTSSSRTGRVKVRTAGGSENMMMAALRNSKTSRGPISPPERAGQLLTIERQFTCTLEEFSEKMIQLMGPVVLEPDGSRVWKQSAGDARVVVYGEDKRVKVIGRTNQVRSLVVIVSPYTEAAPLLRGALLPRQLPQPQGPPQNAPPSAAYAPASGEGGAACSGTILASGIGNENIQGVGALPTITKRVVAVIPFDSEGQGELSLDVGEVVIVAADPENEKGNGEDRWVFGHSETTGLSGWFPLSHTAPEPVVDVA